MTRRRILYLAHRVPYPPDKGDRIRTFHTIAFLAKRGHEVHLAALADEPVLPEHRKTLQRNCADLGIVSLGRKRWLNAMACAVRGRTITEGAFSSRRMRLLLQTWSADLRFDAVIASGSSMHSYLDMPCMRGMPVFVDLMDVDSQKWFDYAARAFGPQRLLYQLEGKRLRTLEQQLAERARALVLVSAAEAALLPRAQADIRVIANGVDLEYFHACPARTNPICTFVGALNYHPNVDGITWLCREVWPEVLSLRPDARLRIVGRRPVPAVERLAGHPGIELIGQVEDVRPHVEAAAVVVAPLRIARGVQNKVLEAFAMARAVVASPESLCALTARPDIEVLVAQERADWVRHLVDLFGDPERQARLGLEARRYVEEHHRWDACLEPWEELLRLGETPV